MDVEISNRGLPTVAGHWRPNLADFGHQASKFWILRQKAI